MKPEDLITYCGVYGGSCARWCEYTVFRDLANVLAEWVDAQGYQYWMPEYAKEFDYNEFRKGLDFLGNDNSWLVCRKCCKGGDGNPECEIRICCHNRKVDLCFECSDFPCERLKGNEIMLQRAREYKKLGKEKWLKKQMEEAKQGFELHTGKFYEIYAKECPTPKKSDKNKT